MAKKETTTLELEVTSKNRVRPGLKAASRDIEQFGSQIGGKTAQASRGIAALGNRNIAMLGGVAVASVGAFAVSSLNTFSQFEDGVRKTMSVMPAEAKKSFDAVASQHRDLAKSLVENTADISQSMYQLFSEGFGAGSAEMLESIDNLADAGFIGLTDATTITTKAMNAYSLSADQAGRVTNVLFEGVRLAAAETAELGQAIAVVAPTAQQTNVTLETTTAALADLTVGGLNATTAAAGFRQMLAELSKEQTKVAQLFIVAAGETFPEYMARTGDLSGAMQLLDRNLDRVGQTAVSTFGSIEASQSFAILTDETDVLGQALGTLTDGFSEVEEAAEFAREGVSEDMEYLGIAFEDAKVQVGSWAAAAVRGLEEVAVVGTYAVDIFQQLAGADGMYGDVRRAKTGAQRIQESVVPMYLALRESRLDYRRMNARDAEVEAERRAALRQPEAHMRGYEMFARGTATTRTGDVLDYLPLGLGGGPQDVDAMNLEGTAQPFTRTVPPTLDPNDPANFPADLGETARGVKALGPRTVEEPILVEVDNAKETAETTEPEVSPEPTFEPPPVAPSVDVSGTRTTATDTGGTPGPASPISLTLQFADGGSESHYISAADVADGRAKVYSMRKC